MDQLKPEFAAGALPEPCYKHVQAGLEDLVGTWIEVEKPEPDLLIMLKRIGIGAIKRRIVVKANSEFYIERRWPAVVDFTKDTAAVEEKSEHSDTEATTEPSSPVRGGDFQSRWYQKQMFPMGRYAECEVVTNLGSDVEVLDKETGSWQCSATVHNNVLIQKRVSESLGLTAFESRALVDRKFKMSADGALEYLEDDKEYNERNLMLFQWKLIDHRKEETLTCFLFLQRVGD